MNGLKICVMVPAVAVLTLAATSAQAGWSCCKRLNLGGALQLDLRRPLKPTVETSPTIIRDTIYAPLKAGEKVVNQAGDVLMEVKVAGERLTEARVYAAGSIASCLKEIGKCVKDRPLEMAGQGFIIQVKDSEAIWDLVDTTTDKIPDGGVKKEIEKNFGKGLMWAGNRVEELPDTVERVAAVPADIEKWTMRAGTQVFRDTVGSVGDMAGGDIEKNLDKLVAASSTALDKYSTYLGVCQQNEWFAQRLGRPAAELMGKTMHYLGYYLAVSAEGFPQALSNPANPVEHPVGQLNVRGTYLYELLKGMTDGPIKIGQSRDDALTLSRFQILYRPDLNALLIDVTDAQLGKRLLEQANIKTSQHIRRALIQVIPSVEITDDYELKGGKRFGVVLKGRVLFLDVDGVPQRIDQMLAYVINDIVFKRPIVGSDITDVVTLRQEIDSDRNDETEKRVAGIPTRQVAITVGKADMNLQVGL